MKIGVFGDSFADKNCKQIWWQYLRDMHGHDVTCLGESGSSLSFSVDLIDFHYKEFDKLLWCATSVNRISFWHKDTAYHNTGTYEYPPTHDIELDQKRSIIYNYLTRVYDYHFQEILGHALIQYMLQKYQNLTIIPCFATPVYFQQEPGFNLYQLCEMETKSCFPNDDPVDIINSKQDGRQGHLTKSNQQRLAQLINNDLDAKIFSTSYDNLAFGPDLINEFGG